MQVKEQKQLLDMVNSMFHVQKNILKIREVSDCLSILEKCQQAAIVIGNRIEQEVGVDKQIVPLLEEYCELLYQFSLCTGDEGRGQLYVKLEDRLKKIQDGIQEISCKYRVVFLPYKADMWDSLESIWRAFSRDDRFECDVVPLPYCEANRKTNQWEVRYDGPRFPSDIPLLSFEYYRIEDMRPDIAFVHNPFDEWNYVTRIPPFYYSSSLKKYVDKLVYVPYTVNIGFIAESYQELPSFEVFDYIIVQSERARESCRNHPHYNKAVALGSPKFDKVINKCKNVCVPEEWRDILQDKKVLMLNTTLSDLLDNEECLLNKLEYVFRLFHKYKDIILIWRPHPLLEATIKAMRVELIEKYDQLLAFFREKQIGIMDFTGDVSNTIAISDGYIGSSYSSVVDLFAVCGKPCYLLDSKNIYERLEEKKICAEEAFHRPDEWTYFACWESEKYMIEDFIEDLVNENLEMVRERQVEALKDIAVNLDGTCGQKVHDFMADVVIEKS